VPASYFEATPEAVRVPPRYFKPLEVDRIIDVQPVLSPDNYLDRTHELIKDAQRSVFFQNQSLKIRQTRPPGYEKLLRALLDKQEAGLDVRIIFRPFQDIRNDLEALQEYGFDMSKVKLDPKCHTKGIIVDSRAALLGSHNWTNAGTSYNRDASLIFRDREIAEFFEEIFLYDWSRARRARIDESVPAPRIARPEETVPPAGMVKVRLVDLELE
jgi:phosphatidylserine/phosphatidylglycerophosphate/cardiolipin synthase-like enzyme